MLRKSKHDLLFFFFSINDATIKIGGNMDNKEYKDILKNYVLERALNSITPNMAVKRKSKYGYFKSVSPEVRYKECDITKYLRHKSYNEVILRFKKILDNELSHYNNNGFYENIKSLYITEYQTEEDTIYELEEKPTASAVYDEEKNDMAIFHFNTPKIENHDTKEIEEDIATHELLHMSTTYKKGIITLCGFYQAIGGKHQIGVGLNEGYTEILNERYFSNLFPTASYINQKHLALGIEEIVGKETMEKLYFDANLAGLIDELSKYVSKEEAVTLIREIDEDHMNEKKDFAEYYKKAINLRNKIASIQNLKNSHQLANGEITQEEYNYNNLKSLCYKNGYVFNKTPSGYSFRYTDGDKPIKLTNEAYRVLINTVGYKEKENDFVVCAYKLNKVMNNIDLSQVERIELTNENEKGYITIPRKTNEKQSQLDEMTSTSITTDTANIKKHNKR